MHLEAIAASVCGWEDYDGPFINRYLENIPPGMMKSLRVSVFFPAWLWGPKNHPYLRFVCASHSLEKIGVRDSMKMRRLIMSDWYKERWGDRVKLAGDQNAKTKYETTATGFREAIAADSITGVRGDFVLIDDPHSVTGGLSDAQRETTVEWFLEAVPTRLNNPKKSAIIVIMQRIHESDVSGVILDKELGYEHLCYPADVEVLSRSGWKTFAELVDGEEVMGVDPETLKGRWETPTNYVRYVYNGQLHRWSSDVFDLAVTPDHRMVFKDYNDWQDDRRLNWRVKPASELPKHFYVPQAVDWSGDNLPSIVFGGKEWEPEVFADFMGWYLSEGCSSVKACSTRIVQKVGDNASEITSMLARSPFPTVPKRHCRDDMLVWRIGSKSLAEALEPLGISIDKRMPDMAKNMPPHLLKRLLVVFAKGDGHFAKRNANKITISSRSKRLVDDLQECAVKAGWAASVSYRDDKDGNVFNGYVCPAGRIWKLYIRASKVPGEDRKWYAKIRSANCSVEQYNGEVFCVSVPSTALVVRRNGRVAVSGNCLPMEFDPARKCVTSIGFEDPRTEDGELLFPERFPREVVERDKRVMGPYATAGQFQQIPSPRGGGIVKREWWQLYDEEEAAANGGRDGAFPPMDYIVASLDPAYTEKKENDLSALTIWGVWQRSARLAKSISNIAGERVTYDEGTDTVPVVMMMHAWQKRLPIHGPEVVRQPHEDDLSFRRRQQENWGLVEHVTDACKKFKVDVLLIEAKGPGISVGQSIKALHRYENFSVRLIDPGKSDKVARAYAIQPIFSNGQVYAPDRGWSDMVISQFESFPRGAHDDLVDSTTQALRFLRDAGLLRRSVEVAAEAAIELRNYRPNKRPVYEV